MIKSVNPLEDRIVRLINELSSLNGNLYPKESTFQVSPEQLVADNVHMLAFYHDDLPIGIAGAKPCDGYYEIKRMYVRPGFQGRGVAQKLLSNLEDHVQSMGTNVCKLETGVKQKPAIKFYEKMGYQQCSPFGGYTANDFNLYFEKKL